VSLKPQDVLILLKLVAVGKANWSYNSLSVEVGMSPSEVHAALKRSIASGLAMRREDRIYPNISNLEEFLIHGLKYVFIPDRGELTRGLPTGHAAAPLKGRCASSAEPPPVWPDPSGPVRGLAFSPLYKSASKAAQKDHELYELLVLVDAIRGGRARERELSVVELKNRLKAYGKSQKPQY
jgi:hypothetical protein